MSTTTVAANLDHEARIRPRVAAVAASAGVLLLLAAIVPLGGPQAKVNEITLALITESKRSGRDLIAAALNFVAALGVAGTLYFLVGAARARNPQFPGFIRWVAVGGPVLSGTAGLIYAIVFAQKAHDFVSTGDQTYQQAHQLTSSGAVAILPLLALLGAFLGAVAIVLVSLQAMRVGLLTRFMGYLGVFGGVLVLFQFTPLPIVEVYWLLALAVLFAGRWPSGTPASWSSGKAEPWPSAQELREQRIRAAGGDPAAVARGGARARKATGARSAAGNGAKAASEPGTGSESAVVAPSGQGTRQTPKRKRKRKR